MIVVMEADAPAESVEAVVAYFVQLGSDVHRSSGQTRTILGVMGSVGANDAAAVAEMDGVAKVVRVTEPYRLASRRFRQRPSIVQGEWGAIGSDHPWIAIETLGLGHTDHDASPESLPYAVAAGRPFDAAVSRSAECADNVGSLACLSLHEQPVESKWPVLFITREPSWTLERWIEAAERELVRGTDHVVLLEAGGVYPDGSRTLEITNVPRVRAATHLPLVVDVPVVAGRKQFCAPIAAAAIAAGASGVILRAWVGAPERPSRLPAALSWNAAVELAERLRSLGEAIRP
jgi:3-deoxy-7-phosphoheptulonate synthase